VVWWWRTGRPNPCVVVVILVVAYRGTWGFTTCSRKGGRCGVDLCPAPTGLAVVGMSRSLRWVCVVVLMLC